MTPDDESPMDGQSADPIDEALQRRGEELRGSTTQVDGQEMIANSLRHKVGRARRLSMAVVAVSALVVVAMLGLLIAESRDDRSEGGSAKGATTHGPSDTAAKLVASLPPQPIDPHEVKLIASVSRYDTCDALAGQLRKVGAAHVGSLGFNSGNQMIPLAAAADKGYGVVGQSEERSIAFTGPSDSGNETLGTNVVVAGVDEPDSVKATGSLVVDLAGTELRVTDTKITAVVGTLELGVNDMKEQRYASPNSLMVEGTRAVVFGNESVSSDPVPGDPSATRPQHNYLTVTFVDLGVPSKPTVVDRVRIEGGLVAARRVGNDVRILTNSSLADLPLVMPTSPNSVPAALHQNRIAVAESTVDDWIPNWDRGESTKPKALMGCGDVVVPDTFAGVQMTSLVQFPIDQKFEPLALGILAPSENLTASATDVVVASHVWVDPINQTEDYTNWSTALHRFVFGEDGPKYIGSGAVGGSVRDEFSLSAFDDGTVGVVTVEGVPWTSREKAKVTVRLLASDANNSTLDQVGSLVPEASEGGVGGVRFMGDRLLVTSGVFGTVVSAVDLSDRAAPRDLGSVSLDGTGDYLHPIGDNRVLVLGATMSGEPNIHQGIHMSILDLSGTPAVVARWALDYAYSQANFDHHAFTWWPGRSIAAFDVSLSSPNPLVTPPPEAAFLTISGDRITPVLVRPSEADLGPRCPKDQIDHSNCDDTGPPDVYRVLVVDGDPWLYTSESLEHLSPDTFASVGILPLRNTIVYGMYPR